MDCNAGTDLWKRNSMRWHLVTSPQRPIEEDGRLMLEMAAPILAAKPAPGVLVMGVTPEIVQLAWPAGTRLTALDQSADMIATIWRPHPSIDSRVARARWQAMPLKDHAIDLGVGDGSLNALPSLADYPAVVAQLSRVLRPGGALVIRCFVRPDRQESLAEVAAEALAGRIAKFAALRWRLAMAMAGGDSFTVAVAEIGVAFNRAFPDRDHLAHVTGWERASLDMIDDYRNAVTRFSFPTLEVLRAAIAPGFELAGLRHGRYELAERCPTLLLRRTSC
jgi:SAM-dependent methyltransferase